MKPDSPNWHSEIEAAHQVRSASGIDWDAETDVIVIGIGGAGVACALQALENGLSVIALDKFEGGGATTASGGVFYAGGGTSIQKEAGVTDTPENMFNYLKMEVGKIVKDATLRDFCKQSAPTIEWMRGHGVDMRPTLWPYKTSFPGPEYFLYHSDNTLVPHYRARAEPAARGHRGYAPLEQSRKATSLGGALFYPLLEGARKRGLVTKIYCEARQLITDTSGRITGVKVLEFANADTCDRYIRLRAKAHKMMALVPPILPGSKYFMRKVLGMLEKAKELEAGRNAHFIRAHKGVLLSAGGFIFNRAMVAYYAPKYLSGYPLGTDGDSGAGIRLGQTVGGYATNMDRITAWRFINPPLSFARGMIVNSRGKRFINEMVYGATLGTEMVENQGAQAWMILDKSLVKQALHEVSGKKALNFQKALARINARLGARKAGNITALAKKIGVDSKALKAQMESYNALARGETEDVFHKPAEDAHEMTIAPFYAIDIGLTAKFFPCPSLTLGGLAVNEKTGQVVDENGKDIKGLYAAGRNAIGIASWNYISGLSIADGVYSGRRAAKSMSA